MSISARRLRRVASPVNIEQLEVRLLLSVQTDGHVAIAAKYAALGGASSFLANATSNEIITANGNGLYQYFQGGMIVWSAFTGAHEVHGAIVNKYNELGGPNGSLGLPVTDEVYTSNFDGRMNTFQNGTIFYNYATGTTRAIVDQLPAITPTPTTTPTPTPISIDVLTPPNFREGDVFTATVMDGAPGQIAAVQVIGNYNSIQYQFPLATIDNNGNATFALRMPYVLSPGYAVDGRTIRIIAGNDYKDFHVTLNEGQRVSLSADTAQEGKNLTVSLRNGIGNSQTIIQLTKDNNTVVHEWGYMQTDGSGNGTYQLQIPSVLPSGYRIDGYGLRVIQGGMVTDRKIAITEGFRVEVGAKKVRETVSTFPIGIRNATPNANVTLNWYLDDAYRTTQTFRTDSSGDGNFSVPTPRLIKNGAGEDNFRLTIAVDGQPNTFTFSMLVYKYTSTNTSSPDPGGSQVVTVAPPATKTNSAPGVSFRTPTVLGVTDTRPITPAENQTLAAQDPVVTLHDRMKHQLVILCYGSDQYPGQNAGSKDPFDKPGMDSVYADIVKVTGFSHVLQLQSGNKTSPLGKLPALSAYEAFLKAQELIAARINLLNDNGQRIDSVVLVGYSWGGGMAKRLATWISTYNIEVSGLVYVDAVNHGSVGHETSLPNVKPSSFLNIYQNKYSYFGGDTATGGDGKIDNWDLAGFDGTAYYRRYRDFDVDKTVTGDKVNNSTHLTIDNNVASVVAEFINGVVSGWYGEHRS